MKFQLISVLFPSGLEAQARMHFTVSQIDSAEVIEVHAINVLADACTNKAERVAVVSTCMQRGGKGQRQKPHE